RYAFCVYSFTILNIYEILSAVAGPRASRSGAHHQPGTAEGTAEGPGDRRDPGDAVPRHPRPWARQARERRRVPAPGRRRGRGRSPAGPAARRGGNPARHRGGPDARRAPHRPGTGAAARHRDRSRAARGRRGHDQRRRHDPRHLPRGARGADVQAANRGVGQDMTKRIVLAYSGGLDTSVAIPWLAERFGAEVIAVTLDLGQGRELTDIRERALTVGALRAHVLDVRDEFAREYILPALQAGAVYEDSYPLA